MFNSLKKYPELLDIENLSVGDRKISLRKIFQRDIEDNSSFSFNNKLIRPIKKEDGVSAMDTLFHHLTTRNDEDDKGKKLKSRSFEIHRSRRLHWIKHIINEFEKEKIIVFSYEDRDFRNRKDVIRTYLYNQIEKYVIILEPQRSRTDYYLLTAYYLNEKRGFKQIKQKLKNKLDEVY